MNDLLSYCRGQEEPYCRMVNFMYPHQKEHGLWNGVIFL